MFTEPRIVLPVIGAILMAAITVIPAVVTDIFALGFGDQVGDATPRTSFMFDYDETELTITHESGAQTDGNLVIIVGDVNIIDSSDANEWSTLGLDTISMGEPAVVQDTDEDGFVNGDTAHVV